jgi:hypothetical protein
MAESSGDPVARFGDRHVMRALQEGVVERAARIPDHRVERRGERQVTERLLLPERAQHLEHARHGRSSAARETPSDMPRGGSFTVSQRSAAITIPGTPARMNVDAPPEVLVAPPPKNAPSELPIGTPRANTAKALPRRLFGK